MTLSKVLQNDEATICDVWMDKLRNEHKVPIVLTKVRKFTDYKGKKLNFIISIALI